MSLADGVRNTRRPLLDKRVQTITIRTDRLRLLPTGLQVFFPYWQENLMKTYKNIDKNLT